MATEKEPLDEEFTYEKDALVKPLRDAEIPKNCAALHHFFSYDFERRNNLHILDHSTVLTACGNVVKVFDFKTGDERIVFGQDGAGIGAISVHPSKHCFAVAEKAAEGASPCVYIYKYPSLELYRVLREGTEKGSNGTNFATVGSWPDFMLCVWNWQQEKIVLRAKAFSQEVYNVKFNPDNEGKLTTSGTGHIRFWEIANSFTGMKLQGLIGKFGKVELTDVSGFAELPDGKVLSGTEYGELLLWDGNSIKCEIEQTDGFSCHDGEIESVLLLREKEMFVTAGADGAIDNAEIDDDHPKFSLGLAAEISLNTEDKAVAVKSLQYSGEDLLVQDGCGALWMIPEGTTSPTLLASSQAGKITGLDVSGVDHFAASCAQDGTVKLWDYVSKKALYSTQFPMSCTTMAWAPTAVDPRGRTVAVGFEDGVVRLLHRGAKKWIRWGGGVFLLMLRSVAVIKPHTKSVLAIAWCKSGSHLVTVGEDLRVFLWSIHAGEKNGVSTPEVVPIGFALLPTPFKSLAWRPDSRAFMVGTTGGTAIEFEVPRRRFDVAETYKIDFTTRTFKFLRTPTLASIRDPSPSGSVTPDPGSRSATPALTGSRGPSPAPPGSVLEEEEEVEEAPVGDVLGVMYSQEPSSDKFYLALAAPDHERLHLCAFDSDYSCGGFPVNGPISFIAPSLSGRSVLTGGLDGSVWVTPSGSANHLALQPHDGKKGAVSATRMSYDDRFLLSGGHDGQLSGYRIDPELLLKYGNEPSTMGMPAGMLMTATEANDLAKAGDPRGHSFDVVFSPVHADSHDEDAEELYGEATDISDPEAYSIEEVKQKTEEDNRMLSADSKKDVIRGEISNLRKEFETVVASMEKLPPPQRLCRDDLDVDPDLTEELRIEGQRMQEEVQKEEAYTGELQRILLEKIRGRFIDPLKAEVLQVETIEADVSVAAYRIGRLRPALESALQSVHRMLNDGSLKEERRAGRRSTRQSSRRSLRERAAREKAELEEASDGAPLKGWNLRKLNRQKRKLQLAELRKEKPAVKGAEESEKAIKHAIDTLGDFKLKTSDDYVVPDEKRIDAQKKRRQLLLLEEALFNLKSNFNEELFLLRDEKDLLLRTLEERSQRLMEIGTMMEDSSLCYESAITSSLLTSGMALPSAMKMGVESGLGRAPAIPQELFGLPVVMQGFRVTAGDPSEVEQSTLAVVRTQLSHEKEKLEKETAQAVKAFDRKVAVLERGKSKLDAELAAAEVNLLASLQELSLLQSLEKDDSTLNARLEKCEADKEKILQDADDCEDKLVTKQEELASWLEKSDKLFDQFQELVPEDHPFQQHLCKIFKKKIKRSKGGDEDDEWESDEWDSDADMSDEDDDDDEDACPPGCDQALYDKVLELREKRLDQEEVLAEFQKAIDDLKKSGDRFIQRQKHVDLELKQTLLEIEAFQNEKQKRLNEVVSVVPLAFSQLYHFDDIVASSEDNSISASLVFNRGDLHTLSLRIDELKTENEDLHVELKALHKSGTKLRKDKQRLAAEIEGSRKKCDAIQVLKFGQKINLDSLEKMTSNQQLEDVEEKLRHKELQFSGKLASFKKKQRRIQQNLLEATATNTKLLKEIAAATSQQQALDKVLGDSDSGGKEAVSVHVNDDGPIAKQQQEERARLVNLVKLQSKEIEALRSEIGVLRQKGGYMFGQ